MTRNSSPNILYLFSLGILDEVHIEIWHILRERKMHIGLWCGRLQAKAHLKDLEVEWNVIIKCT